MKKHYTLPPLWVKLLVVFAFFSCSKEDIIKFKPGKFDLRDGNNVYTGCRIKQTLNPSPPNAYFIRSFEYNSAGDPVSVKTTAVGTGNPQLYFTYDKKGRLLEYYGLYYDTFFEFLHRYGYSKNRIVTDTVYIWGDYPTPSNYASKRISYVQYDELNRVAQDSDVYIYPDYRTEVIKYSYDAAGNRQTYASNYDQKMNLHRTNRVWMFVDRNYSLNNPVAATSYNSSGLPLQISADNYVATMVLGNFYYYKSVDITYDCQSTWIKEP